MCMCELAGGGGGFWPLIHVELCKQHLSIYAPVYWKKIVRARITEVKASRLPKIIMDYIQKSKFVINIPN